MEPLQRSIPLSLKNMITSSESANLGSSCAALNLHFSNSPLFEQLLQQLMDPCRSSLSKDSAVAQNFKLEGNAALKNLNVEGALSSYTKALRYAPFTPKEEDKAFLATVFVNRAATLHKLKLFEPALRDCGRAIEVNPSYSKAWFRRSRIKYDLLELEDAYADMKEALSREKTGSGRKQIENEIMLIEAEWKSRSSSSAKLGKLSAEPKTTQGEGPAGIDCLHLHWREERGWDLRTNKELEAGSLVFQEEAYAAIVLKSSRDTHCHYCFELLPVDPVACSGCAIPMYCSSICKSHAATGYRSPGFVGIHESEENKSGSSANAWEGEHTRECGGCTWPAVLPTDAVLSARILFRSTRTSESVDKETSRTSEERGRHTVGKEQKLCLPTTTRTVDTLCSNYERLSSEDKLEIHVLGVTLANCIQRSVRPYMKGGIKVAAEVASQLVQRIAQTRVNSMAIYCMSSPDTDNVRHPCGNPNTNTAFCTVEQVKVAQGFFLLGSSLNHSCVPNVHASFKSRRLILHAVSNISAGSPLEICYGPQVGHMSQLERKKVLLERYYFTCKCPACATVTSSDLFLRSFRCVKQGCMGPVLSPELNALQIPFPGTGSCASRSSCTENVETAVEGKGACIAGDSIESHETSGSDENFSPRKADSRRRRTEKVLFEDAVPDDKFISVDMSRNLTCKDMVGRCLDCGTPVDVESASEIARTGLSHLERIESEVLTPDATVSSRRDLLKRTLDAVEKLSIVLHPYNEQLAKAEDVVARLLCALDRPLDGLIHCQNAVRILERLYNKHHIVLGNEYLKLASIALIVPDLECARRSLRSAEHIFRIHYGSGYHERLPYITNLSQLVHQE